jgi:hypothetical protein
VRCLTEGPSELAAEVRRREAGSACEHRHVERLPVAGVDQVLGAQEVACWRNVHRLSIAAALRTGGRARTRPPLEHNGTSSRKGDWIGSNDHCVGDLHDLARRNAGAGRVLADLLPGSKPGRCRPSRASRRSPGRRMSGSNGCPRTSRRRRPASIWQRRPGLPPACARHLGGESRQRLSEAATAA